ncbi:sigma-70 family RNA polymerase sigma factor [bacterium]|nr:sigma-70 family RNA polymerase sigma factor [candidate division CSSED10-310 bacterium]
MENDDQLYINRCLEGDREAFRELVIRYQSRVLSIIGRMVRDREMARDLAQEVFVKAYTKLSSYDSRFAFKVWILRIATYHTIDYLRRRRPEFPVAQDLDGGCPSVIDRAHSRVPSPEEALLQSEQADLVAEAVRKLDPKLRAVVILRHFEELNYDEIADALDIPMGTVKNRLFRAREKLQKLMTQNSMNLQEVVS